jgi:MYXO-CTERM domain-containing protein
MDTLAAAALDGGLIDTLDGPANYADLNRLLFDGKASVTDAQATPTKAEAASFISAQLTTETGLALLEKRDLSVGATGEVTAVDPGEGQAGTHTYVITIDGTRLPMDAHGRVANGPTDLVQWQGRKVRRSFVLGTGEAASWKYLEAAPVAQPTADAMAESVGQDAAGPPPINRNMLYGLIAAVLILGALLFFRRRRTG